MLNFKEKKLSVSVGAALSLSRQGGGVANGRVCAR